MKEQSITRDNKEEKDFINELEEKISYIDTTNICDMRDLEQTI